KPNSVPVLPPSGFARGRSVPSGRPHFPERQNGRGGPAEPRRREMRFSHNAACRSVLAGLALLGLVDSAAARTQPARSFNGMWSVVIVTTRGDCERAYRYPVAIAGSNVINAGNAAVDISGRVFRNG